MFNKHLLVTLLFVCSLSLDAQEFDAVKNITPAAPQAAEFQKYGEIPVSHYTGTPSINIPLYTIQSYDIGVPIGLSYHASGVKMTEMASWVGAGWSLSAGGQVSRSVRGMPDFQYHTDESTSSYFSGSAIPTTLGSGDWQYIQDVMAQNKDSQPDEYHVSFLGRSIKFHIKKNKDIVVDPTDKVKIERPTSTNQYWVLTDASGTQYTFGSVASSREITEHRIPAPAGGYNTTDYVSSWYLKEIKSVTGHTVTFDYLAAANYTHLPNHRHYPNYTIRRYDGNPACSVPGGTATYMQTGSPTDPYKFKPVRLTAINYTRGGDNYTVEFTAANARRDAYDYVDTEYLEYYKLNSIRVKKGINPRLTILFNYDDLNNNLWLRSVNKVSSTNNGFGGGIEETHSFEYNNHTNWPNHGAGGSSYDMDWWGLYNGAGNNSSSLLIPDFLVPFGADRDYNSTYAQYGMLTHINYPTGGYSTFDYEQHTVGVIPLGVGGIRIKRITSNANTTGSVDMIRKFEYVNGIRATPFSTSSAGTLFYQCSGSQDPYQSISTTDYSTHSLGGGGFMTIGYDEVRELFGENGENGRNVYYFTNTGANRYDPDYTRVGYNKDALFTPYQYNSLTNGKLEKQLTQKKSGSSYITLKEVANTYTTITSSADYINGLQIAVAVDASQFATATLARNSVGALNFLDIVGYAPYRIKPDWVALTKTVEKTSEDGSNFITRTMDFTKSTSGFRWFKDFDVAQEVTYGVSGEKETTQLTYPFNAAASTAHTALRDRYIMSVLESETIVGTGLPTSSDIIGGSKTSYAMQTLTSGSTPMPDQQFQITQGTYGPSGGGQEVLLGSFLTYNNNGLPTEVEDAAGTKTGLQWRHDLLLAQCANAGINEFFYEGFEYAAGMATSNPHTGLQYKSGNYTVIFSPPTGRNYKVNYWYLSGSTWLQIEKHFTGSGMVLTEGSAIDDVRVYPADALMTTYTHDSFYGVTSQSGPDNRPVYYIYDAAGRLKLVKDLDGNIVQAHDYKFLALPTY